MSLLLEAKDLCFSWDKSKDPMIKSLSLSLEGGHIYGLLGRNGAGKTTLIKLFSGCLRPQEGEVIYYGDAGSFKVAQRHPQSLAEIFYVPETLTFPRMNALTFARNAGALYLRFSFEKFKECLNAFEVPSSTCLSRLSFGQRRKAHISFALACSARVIFLDEPSNGLDISAQISLRRLLIDYLSPECSVVVSTHHVREFENLIDEAIVLDRGSILAHERLDELQQASTYRDLESWYASVVNISPSLSFTRSIDRDIV
jgi:ABC-2 type transport system ATP-binding protein